MDCIVNKSFYLFSTFIASLPKSAHVAECSSALTVVCTETTTFLPIPSTAIFLSPRRSFILHMIDERVHNITLYDVKHKENHAFFCIELWINRLHFGFHNICAMANIVSYILIVRSGVTMTTLMFLWTIFISNVSMVNCIDYSVIWKYIVNLVLLETLSGNRVQILSAFFHIN